MDCSNGFVHVCRRHRHPRHRDKEGIGRGACNRRTGRCAGDVWIAKCGQCEHVSAVDVSDTAVRWMRVPNTTSSKFSLRSLGTTEYWCVKNDYSARESYPRVDVCAAKEVVSALTDKPITYTVVLGCED